MLDVLELRRGLDGADGVAVIYPSDGWIAAVDGHRLIAGGELDVCEIWAIHLLEIEFSSIGTCGEWAAVGRGLKWMDAGGVHCLDDVAEEGMQHYCCMMWSTAGHGVNLHCLLEVDGCADEQ